MILGRVLALLCASAATADYVVDWRVPQANDANANAWVETVTVPRSCCGFSTFPGRGRRVVCVNTLTRRSRGPRRPREAAPAPRRQAATRRRRGGGAAGAQALLRIGAHVCGGRRRRVAQERHHPEPPNRPNVLRHLVPTVQELKANVSYLPVGRLVRPTTHDLCIRSKNSFTWWNGTPAKRARLSSSAESPT